jgi:hypothetical protein
MAKRTRRSAKSVAVIDEKPPEIQKPAEERVEQPPEPPPPPPPPVPVVIIDTCGSCGIERRICYYDSDINWELPGHPDHFSRPICRECVGSEFARNACMRAVYDAMRKKLTAKGMAHHDVEEAVHAAWRTFSVDYDNDALVKLSKQLKVKADWLKR